MKVSKKVYTYSVMGTTWKVQIVFAQYQSGNRLYMGLITKKDGEDVCDITVFVDGVSFQVLGDNEILVKNHTENEGMADWLVKNGIATFTGKYVSSGYVQIPVMQLTESFMKENNLIVTRNIPEGML